MFLKKWSWWLISGLFFILIANVYPTLLYLLKPAIGIITPVLHAILKPILSALVSIGLLNSSLSFVLTFSLPGILGVFAIGFLIGMLISWIYIKIKKPETPLP